MPSFSKACFIAIGTTVLSILPMSVDAREPVKADIPTSSSSSCNTVVNEVAAELEEKGYFVPWQTPQNQRIEPEIKVSDDDISNGYYNYPTDRLRTVTFQLSGDMDKLYNELMTSPVFMSTRSAQIMAACPQVGLVEFQHWWEGVVPVGYFTDNTARPFQWIEADYGGSAGPHHRYTETSRGRTLQYEWGYYSSL